MFILDFGYKIHLGGTKACDGNFFSESYAVEDEQGAGLNDKIEGCKNKCHDNVECMFFVLTGETQNWCLLYKSCDGSQTMENAVVTFSRHTTGINIIFSLYNFR